MTLKYIYFIFVSFCNNSAQACISCKKSAINVRLILTLYASGPSFQNAWGMYGIMLAAGPSVEFQSKPKPTILV